jgi:flagellar motor switch protein FliG
MTRRQKAAVLVQVLLGEGATLELSELPEDLQLHLAHTLATLGEVDQAVRDEVIEEFARELSGQQVTMRGGLGGALRLLDGTINPALAQRLRAQAGVSDGADPWQRIADVGIEKLAPVLERESIEVSAVILSKLAVP